MLGANENNFKYLSKLQTSSPKLLITYIKCKKLGPLGVKVHRTGCANLCLGILLKAQTVHRPYFIFVNVLCLYYTGRITQGSNTYALNQVGFYHGIWYREVQVVDSST